MTDKNAICLLSGGPDSVIAAALARARGYELHGLYVDYGQRTAGREQRQARITADWLGVDQFRVADVPWVGQVGGSAITDQRQRVTKANERMEYVPFRNTIFASLAVAWAEVLPASLIVLGSIGGPWITPDNSPDYFAALNGLIEVGSRGDITAWAPLGEMSKQQVIAAGAELDVPYELTWSCQNDDDRPCTECNNCRDRAGAFAACGLADPLFATDSR